MAANGQGNGHDGHLNGPIDDIQLRSWGIQLVDGRMPGFAAIVLCQVQRGRQDRARTAAPQYPHLPQRQRQRPQHYPPAAGGSVEMGYDTYIVPFGTDTISAVYALGFAVRSALTFGGLKGGQTRDILLYNKNRVYAFVLALGEVDDLKYATAAGAINFGFPVIADTIIPEIPPTGVTTYEHVVSLPFNEIDGATDLERAEKLVQKAIEVRGARCASPRYPCRWPMARPLKAARAQAGYAWSLAARVPSSTCAWWTSTRWTTAR